MRWRYIDWRTLLRHLSDLAPTNRAGSTAGSEASDAADVVATDQQLVRDFLARRAGTDAAMAARLAIIPRILGALCRRLQFPMRPHDLEDVAQDATAIALRKLGGLRPDVPLDAWLHRLCNYELSNSLRRLNRQRAEPVPPDLVSREAAAIQVLERRELLFAALDQLRPEDADIVRTHHLEGRTLAEVAARLRLTENAVKGRYYRAIERLTDVLRLHRPDREQP
jgi:RNA polymerase sigma-70 factor (ECF subfamily)